MMFQILIFARRASGLSREDFIDAYESGHVPLVDELVRAGVHAPMLAYKRSYLRPGGVLDPSAIDPDFDVVVESSFESEEAFRATMAAIAGDRELADRVATDLDRIIDRTSLRYVAVDIHSGGGKG